MVLRLLTRLKPWRASQRLGAVVRGGSRGGRDVRCTNISRTCARRRPRPCEVTTERCARSANPAALPKVRAALLSPDRVTARQRPRALYRRLLWPLARAFSMRSSSRTMTASSVSISDMRFWLMGTVTLPGWVAATALATAKGLPRISVPWGIASFSKRDTRLLFDGTMESAATISIIDAGSSVSPRLGLTSLQAPA